MTPTVPAPRYDVVVPTAGRTSLRALLESLAAQDGPMPGRVVLADDRRGHSATDGLAACVPAALLSRTLIVRSFGRGPAAARNAGWRAAGGPWVAFLDDDVLLPAGWARALAADLAGLPGDVAGSQGRVRVPLTAGRAPTDWERNVAALEDARWATADLAYRRRALAQIEGFDERFPRAYREDADVGLRLLDAGLCIVRGTRESVHAVRDAPWWISLSKQAGNADDPLMTRLHGSGWRAPGGIRPSRRGGTADARLMPRLPGGGGGAGAPAPPGRLGRHALTAVAGVAAAGFALAGGRGPAAAGAAAWAAATAELAWARVAP